MNNSCGPSSAPESWYFHITCLDYLWYLSTVMAMTTDRFMNYSIRKLQVTFFLLIDFFALCSRSITLKKTHNASANFRTSACPRSMNCLMKMEMVCTAFALTYQELVYHHSNSSRMKTLASSYSLTRPWQTNLHSASMVRTLTSGSESTTNSNNFRMCR